VTLTTLTFSNLSPLTFAPQRRLLYFHSPAPTVHTFVHLPTHVPAHPYPSRFQNKRDLSLWHIAPRYNSQTVRARHAGEETESAKAHGVLNACAPFWTTSNVLIPNVSKVLLCCIEVKMHLSRCRFKTCTSSYVINTKTNPTLQALIRKMCSLSQVTRQ
jgi:hypothetical protein